MSAGAPARWRVVAGAALLVGASPSPPAFERAIEVAAAGRVAVSLDRDVYEGARADLGDLRLRDETGAERPYVLESGMAPAGRRQPAIRNRAFVRGKSETVTLDFGESAPKAELVLSLSGDNFRRRVVVEGSGDGRKWATLTDGAYVFAVPDPASARYENVQLPENDYPYLRVTVHHGPDDPERIEIRDAWVRLAGRKVRETPLTPVITRAEDPKAQETHLVLDLGARHQPFRAILVDVGEPRFFRGVAVEARRDPPPPRPGESPRPIRWVAVGEGALYRYEEAGKTRESLRLNVWGRERALRLRIRNRDDRPLAVRGVTVVAPVERLVFEARHGSRYRLYYGSPDLAPPQYDLARTVGDPGAWAAEALPARLESVLRLPQAPVRRPWTERHPVLLWAGLVLVVAGLGGVTWRALRPAG